MDRKTRVEELLKNYSVTKQTLEILKFQLERSSGLSYDEVIEALNFAAPEGEHVQNNNITDKTAKVAMAYRKITERQNEDILRGMVERYQTQKSELDMLEYCVSMLSKPLSEVISDMFLVGLPWAELCDKYHVSWSTLGRHRKQGIAELSKFLI